MRAGLSISPGLAPALTWRGGRWSYDDLARLIDSAPTGRLVEISGLELPAALAAAFAAASAGTSVLIRPPNRAGSESATGCAEGDSDGAALPPGVWLAATTSGTTAQPRTICRTAASWAGSALPLAEIAGVSATDAVLLTGPLFSTLHLHAAIHTLAIGAQVTDLRERATVAHCVPTVLRSILADRSAYPLLRTVIVAGAGLPGPLADAAVEAGLRLVEYYGASELSFVGIRSHPQARLHRFPGVSVRIDAGGVLWARSPHLAMGFLASHGAAGFQPLATDPEGFATVGDLAAADSGDPADGFVILGRGSTAITTGGFTVRAEDVEAALHTVPGVRQAAAFGIPHGSLGEIVAAAVVLQPGQEVSIATIRAAVRPLLPDYAWPRRIVLLDRLPLTPGGKIARANLLELCVNGP